MAHSSTSYCILNTSYGGVVEFSQFQHAAVTMTSASKFHTFMVMWPDNILCLNG